MPFDRLDFINNPNDTNGYSLVQGMGLALIDYQILKASLTN